MTALYYMNQISRTINLKSKAPSLSDEILWVALMIISSKYHQDKHYSNKAWSSICNVSLSLINSTERIALYLLSYDLNVDKNCPSYKNWYDYWRSFCTIRIKGFCYQGSFSRRLSQGGAVGQKLRPSSTGSKYAYGNTISKCSSPLENGYLTLSSSYACYHYAYIWPTTTTTSSNLPFSDDRTAQR